MKHRIKKIFLFISLLLLINVCSGQDEPILPLTADSLASGNYKDVLTSFFQLAIDKITSPQKEIRFTSNPFAVMARINPELIIDTNYYKYRHLRDLNFSFAGKLDSAYRFNGFSSSINYAIINQRDVTISRAFVTAAFKSSEEFNRLSEEIDQALSDVPLESRGSFRTQKTKLFAGEITFNELDPSMQDLVRKIAKKINAVKLLRLLKGDLHKLNFRNASRSTYDSLKSLFQNKLLWTVGVADTTYNNQFMFSNIVISTQLLKGVSDPSKSSNLELDIKSFLNFLDDIERPGNDLKRSVFVFEPGVNWVFKSRKTQKSIAEFKLNGRYQHIFSGAYQDEDDDHLFFNATFRVRIINDVWIPLEIFYDPENGTVQGAMNVKWNFNSFRSILASINK